MFDGVTCVAGIMKEINLQVKGNCLMGRTAEQFNQLFKKVGEAS